MYGLLHQCSVTEIRPKIQEKIKNGFKLERELKIFLNCFFFFDEENSKHHNPKWKYILFLIYALSSKVKL